MKEPLDTILTEAELRRKRNGSFVFADTAEYNRFMVNIGIEGRVCSGKTTLLESCQRDGLFTIEEYREYVLRDSKTFAKFPPTSPEQAKKNFLDLLEIEKTRLKERRCEPKRLAVLDRSIFTLVSFEAGASQLSGINIFGWALDEVLKNRSQVIWPGEVVYLDTSTNEAKRRAEMAGMGTSLFLFDERFNDGVRQAFGVFESQGLTTVNFVDGERDREIVYRDFLAYLMTQTRVASLSKAGISPV